MSDYVTKIGKIKKLGLTKEEFVNKHKNDFDLDVISKVRGYDIMNTDHLFEYMVESVFRNIYCIGGEVIEVLEDNNLEDYDLFEVNKNSDGTYSYILRYYNGGCCFGEALEKAFILNTPNTPNINLS